MGDILSTIREWHTAGMPRREMAQATGYHPAEIARMCDRIELEDRLKVIKPRVQITPAKLTEMTCENTRDRCDHLKPLKVMVDGEIIGSVCEVVIEDRSVVLKVAPQ